VLLGVADRYNERSIITQLEYWRSELSRFRPNAEDEQHNNESQLAQLLLLAVNATRPSALS
jgi:hypothetical protein